MHDSSTEPTIGHRLYFPGAGDDLPETIDEARSPSIERDHQEPRHHDRHPSTSCRYSGR